MYISNRGKNSNYCLHELRKYFKTNVKILLRSASMDCTGFRFCNLQDTSPWVRLIFICMMLRTVCLLPALLHLGNPHTTSDAKTRGFCGFHVRSCPEVAHKSQRHVLAESVRFVYCVALKNCTCSYFVAVCFICVHASRAIHATHGFGQDIA